MIILTHFELFWVKGLAFVKDAIRDEIGARNVELVLVGLVHIKQRTGLVVGQT